MDNLRYNAASDGSESDLSLFPYWGIGLALAGIIAALIFLFPGQALIYTLLHQSQVSEADLYYSLLLSKNQSHVTFGEISHQPVKVIKKMQEELAYYQKDKDIENLWFSYIILRSISYHTELKSNEKQKAIGAMKQYLDVFKNLPLSKDQLQQLAQDSLSINQSSYALYFYEKLLEKNPVQSSEFYTKMAIVALWAKECVKSADYYFKAQHKAITLDKKRDLFLHALTVLFQCDKSELAITLGEQNIDGLSEDAETWQTLIDLAIKANQPAVAQKYLFKYLQLRHGAKTNE